MSLQPGGGGLAPHLQRETIPPSIRFLKTSGHNLESTVVQAYPCGGSTFRHIVKLVSRQLAKS